VINPSIGVLLTLLSGSSAFVSPRVPTRAVPSRFVGQLYSQSQSSLKDPQADYEDGEWHPMDPAYTTPQFLSALWHLIARGNQMVKGVRD
jgi:hypothetical protein